MNFNNIEPKCHREYREPTPEETSMAQDIAQRVICDEGRIEEDDAAYLAWYLVDFVWGKDK